MNRSNFSRRGFLQSSLAALGAAGLPAWYARELIAAEQTAAAAQPPSANDKITMGIIGCGSPQSRSLGVVGEARTVRDLQYVAVCDVDARHLKRAQEVMKTRGHDCTTHKDFREVKDAKGEAHRLPGKTRFQTASQNGDLIIDWDEVEVNLDLDASKFVLQLQGLPRCGQAQPASAPAATPTGAHP